MPVASVGDLETYGLFPDLQDEALRRYALDAFAKMYGATEGKDAVAQFLGQTGLDALKGADILRTAPAKYCSNVEYADNPIAQSLKSVAQTMFADLGTRVYYTQHGSFDTHAGELESHGKLWDDVSGAIGDFYDDLEEHGRADDTIILLFSEFGRRIEDNGSGTDHGSGSAAFVIGGEVNGGHVRGVSVAEAGRPVGGRPSLQQRLPVDLLDDTGTRAGDRGADGGEREVRAARLPELRGAGRGSDSRTREHNGRWSWQTTMSR